MKNQWRGWAVLSLLGAATVQAGPDLTPLDTERKLAQAVFAAHFIGLDYNPESALRAHYFVDHPREAAFLALNTLEATMTPTVLILLLDGIEMPCPGGGSFRADYGGTTNFLLLNFRDCVYRVRRSFDARISYDGRLNIALPGSNTFVPDSLRRLEARDFAIEREMGSSTFRTVTKRRMTMTIDGVIPFVEPVSFRNVTADAGFVAGTFSFAINGRDSLESVRFEPVDEPTPSVKRIDAVVRTLRAHGTRSFFGLQNFQEELTLDSGAVELSLSQGSASAQISLAPTQLRIDSLAHFSNDSYSTALNGRANYSIVRSNGDNCSSGSYLFKTLPPLQTFTLGNVNKYDSGALEINNSAASIYLPPSDPRSSQMRMQLPRFRTEYLSFTGVYDALRTVAACFAPPTTQVLR
jgi:hypothetical protein